MNENEIKITQEKWHCIGCNAILGFVENKRIIRIKRKDLYVEVNLGPDGEVTETCPRCGKRNTLRDIPENGLVDLKETKITNEGR